MLSGDLDDLDDDPGIDEMPKSQIEKRKRNVESTSRVSRREKSRSVSWFEKRTRTFAKKMEKF